MNVVIIKHNTHRGRHREMAANEGGNTRANSNAHRPSMRRMVSVFCWTLIDTTETYKQVRKGEHEHGTGNTDGTMPGMRSRGFSTQFDGRRDHLLPRLQRRTGSLER